ncbi:unknown [Odoribacter sp. CAG:788]|nr:unknown [Odoribacter sp. CAG:788]
MDFDLNNKMHSLTGEYVNTKEAIEDVLVLVNANTKALTQLANWFKDFVELYNTERELGGGLPDKIEKRLTAFQGDINTLKRDISVIQSKIKNIDKLG